ncbi:MAG: DUF342 domain-containing protein [Phycisphaerales bacterium]|nr:DUF342 domain-containing protein [Phycisphaerales bacterium]
MADSNHDAAEPIAVDISRDGLRAWIRVVIPDGVYATTREKLLDLIERAHLDLNESVLSRVEEWLDLVTRHQEIPPRYLVAEGRPPTQGQDGDFMWLETPDEKAHESDSESRINYYTANTIHTVEAGQVVGRIVQHIPAEVGIDVFGERIKPLKKPVEVKMDAQLALDDHDPTLIVSRAAGRVEYKNHTLSLTEILDIKRDVDFSTGSIEASIDVMVKGTIRDHFEVRTKRSVFVRGAIEAAQVSAGQNVIVQGGILGGNKGRVRAKGDIAVKFCESGRLDAGGDIHVGKALLHSRTRAQGRFIGERGTVIGGQLYARLGARIGTLGCAAGVPTEVSFGPDPLMLAWLRRQQIQRDQDQSTLLRITEALRPVLRKVHILNVAQRRRVAEMLQRIRKLRNRVAVLERQTQDIQQASQSDKAVSVGISKIVHEGVTIQDGYRQTTFREGIKGPLRIERRRMDGVWKIVVVNELTGSIVVLPSRQTDDGALDSQNPVALAGTDPHGLGC